MKSKLSEFAIFAQKWSKIEIWQRVLQGLASYRVHITATWILFMQATKKPFKYSN